ncbi:STAS domain-containing protein [Actinosynnema sp. NPDC047251]|uniref:Anti-sigma factor antagonist n=1 Tax=Saccharothrix espanaensis (strain ATCC 51144 / DSM 44229 / JCM 9112 / NBRC 15066 / NRRL 15764) TaxID=1179773 RepID=K0K965_SACES|nr:STAS domain-containing protein [Saccharothrix espanaensis]CCH33379.1 hypothetical protein BN6_61260 [Saccharothrix espanaensis DSM 44229]
MEQPLITVETSRHDDVLLVRVAGEVDLDTVPQVRAVLRGPAVAVVLDLGGVTFFGSAGIKLLVDARREFGALAVVATARAVLHPLQVTGLARHLPLCRSSDAALDHVRRMSRQAG